MSRPPDDPADHAEEFAHTWVDRLENAVEGRMHALDIPEAQIGSSDNLRRVPWRVFFPHERVGGGVSPGGRINVDSGVLNPSLHPVAMWAKARLRDRIDAATVHEFEEAKHGTHNEAVANAPGTDLPINDRVRDLLKTILKAEKDKEG